MEVPAANVHRCAALYTMCHRPGETKNSRASRVSQGPVGTAGQKAWLGGRWTATGPGGLALYLVRPLEGYSKTWAQEESRA